jgi:TPR repeat protein
MKYLIVVVLLLTTVRVHAQDSRLEPLAEQGNQIAQAQLGVSLLSSADQDDWPKGIVWLERAARGGNLLAMYNLGSHYQMGDRVPRDFAKALHYLSLAAELGEMRAMNRLAGMHFQGEGTPKDRVIALKWTLIAGTNGNESARRNLKMIAEEATDEERMLAKEAAGNWLKVRNGDIQGWIDELEE